MNWLHKKRLTKLLLDDAEYGENKLIPAICQTIRERGFPGYETGTPITKNLIEIYERRSRYSGSFVEGLESVLSNLKATKDIRVRIHGFMINNIDYTIFTDVRATKLLGVLKIRENRKDRGRVGP